MEGPNPLDGSHLRNGNNPDLVHLGAWACSAALGGWGGQIQLDIETFQSEAAPKDPVESQTWNWPPLAGRQIPARVAPVWTMSRRLLAFAVLGSLLSGPKCGPLCLNSLYFCPTLAGRSRLAHQWRQPQYQRLPRRPCGPLCENCLVVEGPVCLMAQRSSPFEGESGKTLHAVDGCSIYCADHPRYHRTGRIFARDSTVSGPCWEILEGPETVSSLKMDAGRRPVIKSIRCHFDRRPTG
jgi:hypothetical protein